MDLPINIAPLTVLISFIGLIKLGRLLNTWNIKESPMEQGNKQFSFVGIFLLQIPVLLVCKFKPYRTIEIPPYGKFDYTTEPFSYGQLGTYYLIGIGLIAVIFILYKIFPRFREIVDLFIGR